MTSTTVVRVTGKHIGAGTPNSCGRCPVALALLDALAAGGLADVTVDVGDTDARIAFGDATGRRCLSAVMPESARQFVHAFDLHLDAEPFEFSLTWQEATA